MFFFFIAPATTEISTLSLHDALPDLDRADRGARAQGQHGDAPRGQVQEQRQMPERLQDRKSTRLNSSHRCISYAVFCLKKKNSSACHYVPSLASLASP